MSDRIQNTWFNISYNFKMTPHQANFWAGWVTAAVTTFTFHPYDRAMWLATVNKRPVLRRENFVKPLHGLPQALVQRSLLNSTYFFMQGELRYYLAPHLEKEYGFSPVASKVSIGLIAGMVSALGGNWLSAIKTYTWKDKQHKRTFLTSTKEMYQLGGFKPFLKGTRAAVLRDMTFGSTYEALRYVLLEEYKYYDKKIFHHEAYHQQIMEFCCNFIASGAAAIASSPFNYARAIQFHSAPERDAASIYSILTKLWSKSKIDNRSFAGRCNFFQKTLKIGPGTVRTMAGMSVGQFLFNRIHDQLSPPAQETSQASVKGNAHK